MIFILAAILYSEKKGHKEGYSDGYECGWGMDRIEQKENKFF